MHISGALAGSAALESIAQSEDYGDQQHGEQKFLVSVLVFLE